MPRKDSHPKSRLKDLRGEKYGGQVRDDWMMFPDFSFDDVLCKQSRLFDLLAHNSVPRIDKENCNLSVIDLLSTYVVKSFLVQHLEHLKQVSQFHFQNPVSPLLGQSIEAPSKMQLISER